MKILVFLFPIAAFFCILGIKVVLPETYMSLIQEDSVIEYAQAILYFLSSIISLLVSIRFFKHSLTIHGILYGVLAIGLLFVSIEEISWAQRIFNIEKPDFFVRHNYQNEITFHNLDMVHPLVIHKIFILIGAYGAFAWLFSRLLLSKEKNKWNYILSYVVPDWFISSYFFFVFFIYTLFDFVGPFCTSIGIEALQMGIFLKWRDQEPAELLLSLGFFSFVVVNYIKSRNVKYNWFQSNAC